MNATDLEYFRLVAETGGVRGAAKHLNIAPSAISRRIARLEKQLGTKLLERTSAGMILTATGRRCLTYVHEIHAAHHRLLHDLKASKELQSGHVYVHCSEGQLEFISRAVSDFQEHYPQIRFDLAIASAREILKAVESGKADLGISFSPRLQPPLESAVQLAAPLLAVVEPSHPFGARQSVAVKDLEGMALALPPESFAIRRIFDRVAHQHAVQPNISLCTDSIAAMKAFVRHHGGVTILSYMSITPELKGNTLYAVPFEEEELRNTTIEVFALGRRVLPPPVASFLRYLRAHATPAMLSRWMAPYCDDNANS